MSPLPPLLANGSIRKYLMEYVGQLIMLGLVAQLLVAPAAEASITQKDITTYLRADAAQIGQKRESTSPFTFPSDMYGLTDTKLNTITNALKNAAEKISKSTDEKPSLSFDAALNSMVTHLQDQAGYVVQQVNFLKQIELYNRLVDNLKSGFIREKAQITDEINAKLTECQKRVDNQRVSELFSDLNVRLTDNQDMNATINFWASKIKNGEYKSAAAEFKKINSDTISKYLPDIITNSYENKLVNFENVLEFINDLPLLSQQYRGYVLLLVEMNSNHGIYKSAIIRLAHNVKQFTAKVSEAGGSVHAELKEPLKDLKKSFPVEVRNLIWNGACTMRNVVHNEYLYAAADDLKRKSGDRRVFTWIPEDNDDRWKTWKIEPQDDGKYFILSNIVWNDNQYLSEDPSSPSSTKLFANSPAAVACGINCNNGTNWKLEFGDYFFKILNTQSNKYLYAADNELNYDSERRNVLTTEPHASLSDIWDLRCGSTE